MISNKSIIFVSISMVLSVLVFTGYQYIYQPNIQVEKTDKEICIPKGMEFNELLTVLAKSEVVHEPLSFAFLAKVMKYRDNVKPGCYLLKTNMVQIIIK